MRYKKQQAALGVVCLWIACFGFRTLAQNVLDFEAGAVIPGRMSVAVPGNTGTRFSLTSDLESEETLAFRLRCGRTFFEKHWFGLLVAPLTVKSNGTLKKTVNFNGATFPEGTGIDAEFRFDSYRLIYRYHLRETEKFRLTIGGALKVRDAAIELNSRELHAEKENTGFVPLVSFGLAWKPLEKIRFLVDGEALAAPQGRAEDVLLAVEYGLNESLDFKLGYRFLEGGADNEEVYTFSLFHYLVFGMNWTF